MENVRHISYIKLFTSNDTNIFYLTFQMDLTEFKNIASIAYAPTKKLAILVIYQDYMISNIKQIQKKMNRKICGIIRVEISRIGCVPP